MASSGRTQQQIRDALGVAIKVGEVFTFEDATILWPNLSGAADKFNSEGDRNFNLRLTKQEADELAAVGWNVKCKLARPDDPDNDGEERCVLKVTVNFGNRPPKIVMIGSKTKSRTELGGDLAGLVDSAEIQTCDLSFTPYFWDVNGSIGVTAYLKTMYVVVVEDDLDQKWAEEEVAVEG
jgi:hypothetical protein